MPLGQKIKGRRSRPCCIWVLVLASAGVMSLLGRWEGEGQNVVYADKLARGLPTVCKGYNQAHQPVPCRRGRLLVAERCAQVERLVVSKGQLQLADCIQVAITQPIFDALSSHTQLWYACHLRQPRCGSDQCRQAA